MEISLCFSNNPTPNFSTNSFPQIKKLITERFSFRKLQSSSTADGGAGRITRKQSLLEAVILKPLDDYICSFLDAPLPHFLDSEHVLSGNFFPVDELPPTPCEVVEGSLPPCLDGAYIQNGANPQFISRGPYHMADGDGMLHAVKISGGKATFCSRFVRTHKYNVERDLGYPIFPNVVALFSNKFTWSAVLSAARAVTGQLFNPLMFGIGTANTSLSLFAGRLFAMEEADLPYAVKITSDGDIITIGRHDFHSGQWNFLNMTAHPKIDQGTGEAFAFRFSCIPPYLTFFRIGSDGRKQKDVPILSMKEAAYIHDFAVTQNYAVFPDIQIVIQPLEIMRGRSVFKIDLDKIPRLGVIPRDAEDESRMNWIDAPGLNILHVIHAWEEDEGNRIVIIASNALSIEHIFDQPGLMKSSMEKIVINVKAKTIASRSPISSANLDFGVINPKYAGKKNRYVYAATIESMPKMSGVVKLDLQSECSTDCTVASRMYGPGSYGSEPVFVTREPPAAAAEEEDDGYLVAYVHDEKNETSKFVVMDAKSPSLEIVAVVKLPGRVPHGFHSIFVDQAHLQRLG